MYDGHKSHISLPLINWARQHHIVLFVLPAHTSHVLQQMEVGCFGPFFRIYNNLRHKYIRENATSSIDKHSVCQLGCKAYSLSLAPSNLQSSFRKCGIYPFNSSAATVMDFVPSTVLSERIRLVERRDISALSSSTLSQVFCCCVCREPSSHYVRWSQVSHFVTSH